MTLVSFSAFGAVGVAAGVGVGVAVAVAVRVAVGGTVAVGVNVAVVVAVVATVGIIVAVGVGVEVGVAVGDAVAVGVAVSVLLLLQLAVAIGVGIGRPFAAATNPWLKGDVVHSLVASANLRRQSLPSDDVGQLSIWVERSATLCRSSRRANEAGRQTALSLRWNSCL